MSAQSKAEPTAEDAARLIESLGRLRKLDAKFAQTEHFHNAKTWRKGSIKEVAATMGHITRIMPTPEERQQKQARENHKFRRLEQQRAHRQP